MMSSPLLYLLGRLILSRNVSSALNHHLYPILPFTRNLKSSISALKVPFLNSKPVALKRAFSTNPAALTAVTSTEDYLELNLGSRTLTLPYLWLRDHCRCNVCYNHKTNQKNILIQELDPDIRPEKVEIADSGNGEELSITWPGGHMTQYRLPWLQINAYPGPSDEKVVKRLWNKDVLSTKEQLPRVDFEELVKSDEALKELLESLLKYGVGLVDGVPATLEGTQTASERVCFIQVSKIILHI